MFTVFATVTVSYFALFFSLGEHWSHTRAIAFATVTPLFFGSMWILFLWAWFRRPLPESASTWLHTRGWIYSIFLVILGVAYVIMCWFSVRMFLRA
jgi:hypothetical protein